MTIKPESIVIVGGGTVGLAFALGATRLANVQVSLVERGTAPQNASTALPQTAIGARSLSHHPDDDWDHRVYAITPTNRDFLVALGAWAHLPVERITTVRSMAITGDDGQSQLHLDATITQPLAYIIEHRTLNAALWQALHETGNVQLHTETTPAALTREARHSTLTLADGQHVQADLLVAADGARSWVREQAGISQQAYAYDSVGVVANFTCEQPHHGTARQWFIHDAAGDSILAYLPLPGNRISIVWSVSTAEANRLKALPAAAFEAAVIQAGQRTLGQLTLISPVTGFPLSRHQANDWVAPGLALVGDAAHTVHPLAGQGVNLGFADALTLLDTLHQRSPFSGIGDLALLRRYARARQEPTLAMQTLTHQLRQLYSQPSRWASWLRNQGLAQLDQYPNLKSHMIHYASH